MELFKPDFGLIFWMFVAFAILFFILWKWGWPVIMKSIADRADLIDKGVEYAQNAKVQLDQARDDAAKIMAEASRQQADVLREADKMKNQIIEEARSAAQVEARKVMDAARVSIEQERKQAQQQFRNEVSAFALQIAGKVVRQEMSEQKAQTRLVEQLLDDMEKQN
ncbi:MAG: F0F1 ATP synthase subunit B [Muribaculaceae bacterium]|nr:F0F1 ATP synthase subunit B [Muribaculaceae bacterium]